MKISILTSDFSSNRSARAWVLAKLLMLDYEIEIIGPAFGDGIWKPLSHNCPFETKIVKGYKNGRFQFKKITNLISGDLLYASKPLIASFGVTLFKNLTSSFPIILDIDDWELGFGKEFYDSLSYLKKFHDLILSYSNWQSYYYNILMDKLIWKADALTVSGPALQKKYGGTIIWHARNTDMLKFQHGNINELKSKYIPLKYRDSFIIGFVGTFRPHKGIEDLLTALEILQSQNIILMLIGFDGSSYSLDLKRKIHRSTLREKTLFYPQQPFDSLPELISLIDLIVIPQKKTPFSQSQIPAKIFDAMAMAKPIISTSVSDIPFILEDAGWIVEPDNPCILSKTIRYVVNHPFEATQKGLKANQKFKSEFSWDSIRTKLVKVIKDISTHH
jgi:glycosyltransferase involved in cell wall biosynthesis